MERVWGREMMDGDGWGWIVVDGVEVRREIGSGRGGRVGDGASGEIGG